MKRLQTILSNISIVSIQGDPNVDVVDICIDSRMATKHCLFVAMKGVQTDGHQYITQVEEKGAIAIVCEVLPEILKEGIVYIQVTNSNTVLGMLAANFYDHPSRQFKLVGVTGTNGKTTCSTLLFQLFTKLGYHCGLVSTVQNQIGDKIISATHTTPDAVTLQKLFATMRDENCSHVFMEVSSHAIHQQRIVGTHFAGACFTNITHDHLDYHKTFDEYIYVKKALFDSLDKSAFALTNVDDKRGLLMLQNTIAQRKTYSLKTMADYKAKIIENNLNGLVMMIESNEVFFKMIGEFNAYNLLCVFGVAVELGEEKFEVLQVLSTLFGAEGRFDYFFSGKESIMGIVDYAHTPDALLNVLATIGKLRKGNETLFTVIGCGGDRDKAKRPLMATVACEHSDRVIFTSDNPRNEEPMSIIRDMEVGVPANHKRKYVSIADRKEAIKTACSIAEDGDIILVAGKGHEKYQEVSGLKYPFDDKVVLQEMFQLFEK